ncbi:1048_t:CDS:10 [Acaulospora morrowiae]|uniref:1048_t:CDS:1 n=1 Tax=Acaulospora morrowiae TaxID=94023 RepID=A0A9N9CQS8_9GLOM|nr:1048_t:CDS:10 [Acaulospora morrowiae]
MSKSLNNYTSNRDRALPSRSYSSDHQPQSTPPSSFNRNSSNHSHMSQQEIAAAFVDWVNTFDKLSRPVNSILDLTDGNVLIDIVCTIDPKWFKLTTDNYENREENWVKKFNKLKRLYPLLTRYYEEILELSTKNIEVPNLNSIARDGDLDETMKLCSLVLTLAVRSSNNKIYIEKIQSLSPKSQEGLKVSIERVMIKLEEPTVQSQSSPVFVPEEELKHITAEHRRLLAEKEALERAHQTLMEDHTKLRRQCDDLQMESEELNQKLKELEYAIAQSSQNGKADFLLKTEIDNLRHELSRSENKRHETELLIENQNIIINDLTRRVEILTEQADEAARLKDQLDEFRHATDKLRKTENVIEKYKKKLEEGADVRRSLKNLEQENKDLLERNQKLEDEYHKLAAFKNLMENYKQQIVDLQSEKTELVNQKNKYEYEYKHMRAKIEAYEMATNRDMDKIRLLEDRLHELESGDGERIQHESEVKAEADEIDQPLDDSELSIALEGNTMVSLKLKVYELERELAKLREGKSADGDADAQLLVLQHMLDDANRAKNKFEKDYVRAQQEKLVLEKELVQLQNGSSSNGDKNENRKSFDKERELSELKRKYIEAQIKIDRLEKEIGEPKSNSILEARVSELEAEKEQMKGQNDELNSILQNLEGKSEDDLRSQNIQLSKQVAEKSKKLENLKQLITGQHEIIESYKNNETAVQAKSQAHAEEIARLEQLNKEYKEQSAKEVRLVLSAWFNMGRRIQGDHVFLQRQAYSSFLNQQRQLLDTQKCLNCWNLSQRHIKLCLQFRAFGAIERRSLFIN